VDGLGKRCRFLRLGDALLIGVASCLVAVSLPLLWHSGPGERVVIRLNGKIFREAPLTQAQEIHVPGPLGETRIVIEKGRARVVADPGPRQYCVRQGWLSAVGEIAICAPNRVSLAIEGSQPPYDSLNY